MRKLHTGKDSNKMSKQRGVGDFVKATYMVLNAFVSHAAPLTHNISVTGLTTGRDHVLRYNGRGRRGRLPGPLKQGTDAF